MREKCISSTRNTKNANKHHYVCAILEKNKDNNDKVKFITGQQSYVDKQIKKALKNNLKIAIPKFYNANGIDLRNNTYDEFIKKRKEIIKEVNEKIKEEVIEKNKEIKREITRYNKIVNEKQKRDYNDEKIIYKNKKVSVNEIPVSFTKTSFTYISNKYMSYDEVLNLIKEMNTLTQSSE